MPMTMPKRTTPDAERADQHTAALDREMAAKLEDFARRASAFMSLHEIATAMIATGLGVSLAAHSREATADWLRGIADDLESSTPMAN